jgi:ferric-dicitrate binding protein FerR (iron transport regulator)
MAEILDGTALSVAPAPDTAAAARWVGNFLVFQDAPLREVARELERHFGTRVAIRDPAISERTVTAWFADRPLDEVIRVICAASLAECTIADGMVDIGAP